MLGFSGKKDAFIHKPISSLSVDKLALLWCDSYDCGWVCDIGWKDRDGKLWCSTPSGSVEADMPYTLWSELVKPNNKGAV